MTCSPECARARQILACAAAWLLVPSERINLSLQTPNLIAVHVRTGDGKLYEAMGLDSTRMPLKHRHKCAGTISSHVHDPVWLASKIATLGGANETYYLATDSIALRVALVAELARKGRTRIAWNPYEPVHSGRAGRASEQQLRGVAEDFFTLVHSKV